MAKKSNIRGFENYHITRDGRVFNLNTGLCLKFSKNNKGYLRVSLYSNGEQKRKLVHRLIAEAYLPNPNNYPCVMHLDDNPTNNNVSNLRWATQQENMADRDSKGRQAKGDRHGCFKKFGENHNCSKLSNSQRKEICKKYSTGNYCYKELSSEYGITPRHTWYIVKTFQQSKS